MDSAQRTGIQVLTVGDAALLAEDASRLIRENGGTVHSAATQTEAMQAIGSSVCDLIILDLGAQALAPVELAASIRRQSEDIGWPYVVAVVGPGGRPPHGADFSAVWTRLELDREIRQISQAFGFDRASALTNAGDDPELFAELIVIFLEECPRILDDLRRGIAAGDFHKLEMAAHKLKGGLANFGASGAVKTAQELEDAAGRSDFPGCRDGLLRLELVVLQLTRTLESLA